MSAALLIQPLAGRRRSRASGLPPIVQVQIEDLSLGPADLSSSLPDSLAITPSGVALSPGRTRASLVSPVLSAANSFTHVGLHWSAAEPQGTSINFEVRTGGMATSWSPWEPLLIEAQGRETSSEETFAALLSAPRHTRVQLRATFEGSAASSPLLRGVTTTLLNAKDGPRIDRTTLAASSSLASPDPSTAERVTFTREDWGADESLREDSAGDELWPPMYVPAKKLVVHHTATSNKYSSVVDAQAEVRAIHAYHAQTLGWGDIGYSVIVDKFGNSYEGRYGRELPGGREVLSEDVVAGHALGYNYGSAGLASLGTHTAKGEGGRPGVVPTQAALDTLVELLVWYGTRRGVDPLAADDFLLSDDTWDRGLTNVPGHSDCNATICPGGQLYSLLPMLRGNAATLLGRPAPPDLTATGDTVPLSSATSVGFGWSPTAGEYYLEGWRKVTPESEDLVYLSGYDADRLPAAFVDDLSGSTTLGEVFALFRLVGAIEPGHYSLHMRSDDGTSYQAGRTILVESDGEPNTPPSVSIDAPPDDATFPSGSAINFAGTASDADEGDLSPQLAWTSDLDGPIGTGGSFSATLSDGVHVVTAEVTDAGGLTASDAVTVTVGDFVLTATAYKVKGRQYADLAWSGSTAASVDVLRDGVLIDTVEDTGFYTDPIGARGAGLYVYQVCEAGTQTCSNPVTVTF